MASDEAVGLQFAGEGAVAGADGLQEGVELGTVVEVAQVAEFVEHYEVAEVLRETHKVEIEVDVAQLGAAAPVGGVVLDADLVVGETVLGGEGGEAGRQGRLGLGAQPLDLGRLFGGQGFLLAAASAKNEDHRLIGVSANITHFETIQVILRQILQFPCTFTEIIVIFAIVIT